MIWRFRWSRSGLLRRVTVFSAPAAEAAVRSGAARESARRTTAAACGIWCCGSWRSAMPWTGAGLRERMPGPRGGCARAGVPGGTRLPAFPETDARARWRVGSGSGKRGAGRGSRGCGSAVGGRRRRWRCSRGSRRRSGCNAAGCEMVCSRPASEGAWDARILPSGTWVAAGPGTICGYGGPSC